MTDPTYFAITGLGRSGSTMLTHLLASHPDIECLGEVISRAVRGEDNRVIDYEAVIKNELFSTDAPIRGFKMAWFHIMQYPDIWSAFRHMGFKLVFLDRPNKFDLYLSIKLAGMTGHWASTEHYPVDRITVDVEEAILSICAHAAISDANRQMAHAITDEVFEITYPQLGDPERLNALLEFLGASPHALTTPTIRSRRQSHRELIENFDEVKAAFADTRWAGMLDA